MKTYYGIHFLPDGFFLERCKAASRSGALKRMERNDSRLYVMTPDKLIAFRDRLNRLPEAQILQPVS
jgi:hypothetical protein